MVWAWVAVGGVLGAVLRHGFSVTLGHPLWALLVINGLGSFFAGLLAHKSGWAAAPWAGPLLLIGFCGAFTTFSAYSVELVKLFESGQIFKLACYFFAHNAMCLLLCYIGYSNIQMS